MPEKNIPLNGKDSGKEAKGLSAKGGQEAIDKTIKDIQERFGEGAIMKLGEIRKVDVEAIPTGSISLDFALGIGGIPKGRIVEIFGAESSGKTTLATHIIANAQKKGGKAAFIDAEHAMDPEYARRIGVNIDELLISQPDTGEQALEIAEALVRSATLDVIVIDSVAALTPKAEIEGEMGDRHIGLQARLMSQALRKLAAITSKTNTCIIFINQTRIKIGVMFGNPETTTGGTALKFYSSVRIEIRKSAQIKQGDNIIGCRAKLKIVKNKVAPPFQKAEFDIMYNEGISLAGDALMLAIEKGIVKKSGAWFSYKEEKIGQGFEGARKFLKENPKVLESLIKDIKKHKEEELKKAV